MLRISATVDDVSLVRQRSWTLTAPSVKNRPFVLREYETRATVRGDTIQKGTDKRVQQQKDGKDMRRRPTGQYKYVRLGGDLDYKLLRALRNSPGWGGGQR